MARNVTLLSLRDQAKQRADMVNSNFCTDAEINLYINNSATELYDLLTTLYEDYYVSSANISLVIGTDTYDLPATFYKLLGVDLLIDTNGNSVTLKRFEFPERNAYVFTPTWNVVGLAYLRYMLMGEKIRFVPLPSTAQTVRLWYVPNLTALSGDSSTLDGLNGYEEYVIIDAAIKMLQKEESDVSALMAQKQAIIKRINDSASNRDANSPWRIQDCTKILPYEFWSFGDGH